MILFSIFKNKKLNKKNIKKWAQGLRGCDVARKATWQRHADPRNAPRGTIYHILHYVYIYINRSLSSPYKGGSYPYKRSGIIYPTVSLIKVRVGLFFLTFLPFR